MYLLKLYYSSIIILLANVLANICSEISKIDFMNGLYLQSERIGGNWKVG